MNLSTSIKVANWGCSAKNLFINNSRSDIVNHMVKFILKLLILVFLLESTWAVAAQYCAHELGLKANHFGHHYHSHNKGDKMRPDQASIQADKSSKSDKDKDCPYCHLGAMKSMVQDIEVPPMVLDHSLSPDTFPYHYVNIVQRQPERPNWMPAA